MAAGFCKGHRWGFPEPRRFPFAATRRGRSDASFRSSERGRTGWRGSKNATLARHCQMIWLLAELRSCGAAELLAEVVVEEGTRHPRRDNRDFDTDEHRIGLEPRLTRSLMTSLMVSSESAGPEPEVRGAASVGEVGACFGSRERGWPADVEPPGEQCRRSVVVKPVAKSELARSTRSRIYREGSPCQFPDPHWIVPSASMKS